MTDALPTGETALWRAVVVQPFQDATYGLHGAGRRRRGRCRAGRDARVNAGMARTWLLRDSADFRRVCALAGLEPDAVRRSAKVAIERSDEHQNGHKTREEDRKNKSSLDQR